MMDSNVADMINKKVQSPLYVAIWGEGAMANRVGNLREDR